MTTAHYISPFSVHYSVLKPTLHTVIKILDLQPSPHTFSVIDKALLKRSVHSSFLTFRSLFPAPKENVFVKPDEQWRENEERSSMFSLREMSNDELAQPLPWRKTDNKANNKANNTANCCNYQTNYGSNSTNNSANNSRHTAYY